MLLCTLRCRLVLSMAVCCSASTLTEVRGRTLLWRTSHLQGKLPDAPPMVLIKAEKGSMHLYGDLLDTADKVSKEFIPAAKDDNKVSRRRPCGVVGWEGQGLMMMGVARLAARVRDMNLNDVCI